MECLLGSLRSLVEDVSRRGRAVGRCGALAALALVEEWCDLQIKEEGEATPNGVEEGSVGFGRSENEAVKGESGAPERLRRWIGGREGPDAAQDCTVGTTDGSRNSFGKDAVTAAEKGGGVGREGSGEGVGGGRDRWSGSGWEEEFVPRGMVGELEVTEESASIAGSRRAAGAKGKSCSAVDGFSQFLGVGKENVGALVGYGVGEELGRGIIACSSEGSCNGDNGGRASGASLGR